MGTEKTMNEVDGKVMLEKLKELMELARKKKNALEYNEIHDYLKDLNLSDKQMQGVVSYLQDHDVDVLTITAEAEEPDAEGTTGPDAADTTEADAAAIGPDTAGDAAADVPETQPEA